MSVRAKPALIGLFVSIAIVLAVAAVLMFGGGKLFSHEEQFIIYFSEPPNGLSIGSPVKYKGVQIGQVSNIFIHFDQSDESDAIPVLIEINTTRLHNELGDSTDLSDPDVFAAQIKIGLRARLQMQSWVTTQLFIELDYDANPDKPKLVSLNHLYKEIPSVPSGLSEVVQSITTALENLSKVDFSDMANRINHLTDEITQSVDQLNLKEINDTILSAGKNLNDLLSDPKIREALDKLGSTLDDLDRLTNSLNQQVQPLSDEIQNTAKSARATLDQLNQTLSAVRDLLAPDSPLRTQLEQMLRQITSASIALRSLAEFLEANPTSIITGKPQPTDGWKAPTISPAPTAPPTTTGTKPADAATPIQFHGPN
ncbi:MAG TPA: MlaD family protein [Opitutales bacterium]|jgi:paraquat-inducible protein B|nr:MlaD family protein [Opitutales bacterium]